MTLPVVQRHCARAILLDATDRVLLFWLDPAQDPRGQGYWYLPGGGMDGDETPEEAVARELREEIGIENAAIGPRLVHLTGVRFEFGGRIFEQDEWHLLARTEDAIRPGRANDNEADAVAAHRWWPVADLVASPAVIYPNHLRRTLVAVLRDGAPPAPVAIEDAPGA